MNKVNSKIAKKIIRLLNERSEREKPYNTKPYVISGTGEIADIVSDNKFDEKSTVEIGKLVNEKGDIMYEISIYGGNVEGYMMINDKETVLKINKII